jgi:hypothetical protein
MIDSLNLHFSLDQSGAAIWGARQQGNPLSNVDFTKCFTILDTIDI